MIDRFGGFQWVVVPSGSCAATLIRHYPSLLADDPQYGPRAAQLAQRTFELTTFLEQVAGLDGITAQWSGRATYHDSCSGLRELGVKRAPRAALARVAGLDLVEARDPEACCGFGGTFCLKYPVVSERMTDRRIDDIVATGAEVVIGGDLGCLMTIEGRLRRRGSSVRARHVAEVLAGWMDLDDDDDA